MERGHKVADFLRKAGINVVIFKVFQPAATYPDASPKFVFTGVAMNDRGQVFKDALIRAATQAELLDTMFPGMTW